VQAVYDTMRALRDATPPAKLEGVAPDALMKKLMRSDGYASWGKEFL